jgi:cell division protein ZapA (FtsZ GTPase activity inhibitor)
VGLAEPFDNKETIEVLIAGIPLKLRSSYSEDTVRSLAKVVDDKVKEILEVNPNVSYQKAILLASLNLAEEGMLLKKTLFVELNRLESKAKDLLTDLESAPVQRLRLDN